MGLGSMVGAGVFVSIGLAAGVAGPSVIPAIALAAFVALCNGMSSAQLAAAHPVSGGTYEYGYTYLRPELGFSAGWMFLLAKSASAATAALGFSGYLLHQLGMAETVPLILPAFFLILLMTLLVRAGVHRTQLMNTVVVSATLIALLLFVFSVGPSYLVAENVQIDFADLGSPGFLKACALMFVAYTGYGRIATMGEEIREPRKNIPLAIFFVLLVTSTLYLSVALTAVGAVGSEQLGEMTRRDAAPLEMILKILDQNTMATFVSIGALTAMVGVLLNLILGLSRVLLAMGRRGDMPVRFATLEHNSPKTAVTGTGLLILLIALPGNVQLSWSFSAFTVLVYYAITNLSALNLPEKDRLYPRAFSWIGLLACLFLAFQVGLKIWATGLGILVLGLVWHKIRQRYK